MQIDSLFGLFFNLECIELCTVGGVLQVLSHLLEDLWQPAFRV